MPAILVTGAAGFIGYHLSQRLLAAGHAVVGIDNLNDYYDPALKRARLARLQAQDGFAFEPMDLADGAAIAGLFARHGFRLVAHMAAQAGVRYSLQNPQAYGAANLTGFLNMLEGCRHGGVEHLVYASSSSVYGGNTEMPFRVGQPVDRPLSLYAASKRANELMAHSYSHLYGLPTTGLRFFTVYGPWGRPDMAVFQFTQAILEGRAIPVFNRGEMRRDFTYVDDIVDGIFRLLQAPPPASDAGAAGAVGSAAPYRLFNIGNNTPVPLLEMIAVLERCLGRTAQKELLPMQPGDVPATWADVDALRDAVGWVPSTPLAVGLERFADWYRSYYGA